MLAASGGLQSVNIIDLGDERSGTPVRAPLPVRNHTPPRSASNPRSSGSALRRSLAAADRPNSKVLDRAPGRSISRRKQRRWENKNLLGNERLNQILLASDSDDEGQAKNDDLYGNLRIEWRSAFHELFEPQNNAALETFRQCAEQLVTEHSGSQKIYGSQSEEAWHRVNKRLRSVVLGCLAEHPQFLFPFLGALEDVLVHFASTKTLKSHNMDGRLLLSYLASPVRVDEDKVLHVFLKDFKGNRFILHTVCQFYGLQSKSYKKKGSKEKVTAIVAPKRPAPAVKHGLSLTKYLLVDHFHHTDAAALLEEGSTSCSEVEDLGDLLVEAL